jgi:L-threonylcarbamoyladenylate synthase
VSTVLDHEDAARLARCVSEGGVAVFPADTVYGVGCDPENGRAVRRMYELKGRPAERPAAVMFFTLERALASLGELEPSIRTALGRLLPGPLTLLLANPEHRFARACGPDPGTLGLRVPLLPAELRALSAMAGPMMQSSANISGQPEARSLAEVSPALREGADLELDGGELPGRPSTVIDLRDYAEHGRWSILREGALASAAVAELLAAPI